MPHREAVAEIAAEADDPISGRSMKRFLAISGTGLVGIMLAAWNYADKNTEQVTRHEQMLVQLVGDSQHPGVLQKLDALQTSVGDVRTQQAVLNAGQGEMSRRLGDVEKKIR